MSTQSTTDGFSGAAGKLGDNLTRQKSINRSASMSGERIICCGSIRWQWKVSTQSTTDGFSEAADKLEDNLARQKPTPKQSLQGGRKLDKKMLRLSQALRGVWEKAGMGSWAGRLQRGRAKLVL